MLIGFIIMVVIIALIVKLSYVENQNIELLSEKCRNEVYEEYKRKSTKFLNKELEGISNEYDSRLSYHIDKYKKDQGYGSDYICTPTDYNFDKIINGGKSYMRYDKNDMRLYHTYQVISEILDRRSKDD